MKTSTWINDTLKAMKNQSGMFGISETTLARGKALESVQIKLNEDYFNAHEEQTAQILKLLFSPYTMINDEAFYANGKTWNPSSITKMNNFFSGIINGVTINNTVTAERLRSSTVKTVEASGYYQDYSKGLLFRINLGLSNKDQDYREYPSANPNVGCKAKDDNQVLVALVYDDKTKAFYIMHHFVSMQNVTSYDSYPDSEPERYSNYLFSYSDEYPEDYLMNLAKQDGEENAYTALLTLAINRLEQDEDAPYLNSFMVERGSTYIREWDSFLRDYEKMPADMQYWNTETYKNGFTQQVAKSKIVKHNK